MRSLPTPRYSRYRTIRRIWRSIVNLLSTGYVRDSSAFSAHRNKTNNKGNTKTRIRQSRVTKNPTSRPRLMNRISKKVINELIVDDDDGSGLISSVIQNEKANWSWSQWFSLFSLYKRTGNKGGVHVGQVRKGNVRNNGSSTSNGNINLSFSM